MTTQASKKKMRAAAYVLVAMSVLYGLWLLPLQAEPGVRAAVSPLSTPAESVAPVPAPSVPAAAQAPVHPEEEHVEVKRGELIGHVALESESVCRGDDFKVTITPAPGKDGATFNIEGRPGSQQILTATMPGDKEGYWIVASHGDERDFHQVEVRILADDDPACSQKPAARIVATRVPHLDDEYELVVEPMRALGTITSVDWSFGDGNQRSAGAQVTHGYRDRPQTADISSFVVTADVVDEHGQRARARTALSLANLHYRIRTMTGQRPLPTAEQRIGGSGGQARYAATFTNLEDRPVQFEEARVKLHPCEQSDAEPAEQVVPAAQLFEHTALAAGQTEDVMLKVDPAWLEAGACRVEIALSGDTVPSSLGAPIGARGVPAREVTANLAFTLALPKTAEEGGDPEYASQRVTDPAQIERLLAAMQKYDTNLISEEQLRAVE